MKAWSDRLALGIACASAIYVVGLLLARRPATVEVRLAFDDKMLHATATVRGAGSMLRDRLIWSPQENRTARNLTVHPDPGARTESRGGELRVFASKGESIHLELGREQEEAERLVRSAFFDPASASCMVPLSYLGLARETVAAIEYRAGEESTQVLRGLVISGAGWVRSSGVIDVVASQAVAVHSSEAGRLIAQGLKVLRDWNIPQTGIEPLVVLLPKGPRELVTDFHLQDEGIYVVEVGERGLLVSTVFRDLALAACQRIARARPRDEQMIWSSLARVLAARVAMECSLSGAENGLAALQSRYVVRPREESLRSIPEDPSARWRLENIVGPVYWSAMLRDWPGDGDPLRDLLAAIFSGRESVPLRDAVAQCLGEEIAVHVAALMEGRVQLKTANTWRAPTIDSAQSQSREKAACSIVYSGINGGFLDNCGCSISQQGGLSRKVAAVKRERRAREKVIVVDLGDALAGGREDLRRSPLEQEAILTSLAECGYDVLVPGAKELSLDKEWFATTSKRCGILLVAANIVDRATGRNAFDEVRIIERGDLRVGIIGLVEPSFQREWYEAIERSVDDQYQIVDPIPSLERTLSAMPPADICVVAGTILPGTASRILEMANVRIDLVLSSVHRFARVSGTEEMHMQVRTRAHKGMYGGHGYAYTDFDRFGIGRVDIETAPRFWCAFSDIKLASGSVEDPSTTKRLDELSRLLAGRPETWRATPLAAFASEQTPMSAYVGSEQCMTCHADAAAVWKSSAHAHAYATLAKKGKESDPACLRCHTTGFLLTGGFRPDLDPAKRVQLLNVGCETCHGPGSLHVDGHSKLTTSESGSMRTKSAQHVCVVCHDRTNSPGFCPEAKLSLVCIAGDGTSGPPRRTDAHAAD